MTSKEQRQQAINDYPRVMQELVDDNSEAAIVQIEHDEITVKACAKVADAADWLRARGEDYLASRLEGELNPGYFKAVVVNEGGVTVSYVRRNQPQR